MWSQRPHDFNLPHYSLPNSVAGSLDDFCCVNISFFFVHTLFNYSISTSREKCIFVNNLLYNSFPVKRFILLGFFQPLYNIVTISTHSGSYNIFLKFLPLLLNLKRSGRRSTETEIYNIIHLALYNLGLFNYGGLTGHIRHNKAPRKWNLPPCWRKWTIYFPL